jgi:antitoxin MazE
MRTQVQKWGNSLALRIPKAFASESLLSAGSDVEVTIENGRLIVTPVRSWESKLASLIEQITDENRHAEIRLGPPVGKEFW